MTDGPFRLSSDLPPCARCGGHVIINAQGPKGTFGTPVQLQLCPQCDADSPAGKPLLQFFAAGGGKDTSRSTEAAELIFAWQKEAMAKHGFAWVPKTEDGPSGPWPQPRGRG